MIRACCSWLFYPFDLAAKDEGIGVPKAGYARRSGKAVFSEAYRLGGARSFQFDRASTPRWPHF